MEKLKRYKSFDQQFQYALSTLRKQIISGELNSGDYLLSENKLSAKFSISRPSIRKVLSILEQEGLVAKRQGKGTFITDLKNSAAAKSESLNIGVFIPTYENCLRDSFISVFEKDYPLIRVQLRKISDCDNYYEIIQDLVHTENSLDIIFIMDWHFQDFAHEEWITDLKPFMEKSKMFAHFEDDYYSQFFNKYKYNGRQLAIPIGFSPVVMAYNCDMFDREQISYPDNGWDWEQFLETAKLLTHDWNGDGIFEQFGFGVSAHRHRWPSFVYRNNGKFIDHKNQECIISSTETLDAIQFVSDLLFRYRVAPLGIAGENTESHLLFARSKIAMTLVSYFSFSFVLSGLPFKWDIAPCPGKADTPHLMLSSAFMINKQSPNVEIAWQFIEHFLSNKIQDQIRLLNSVVPIKKSSSQLKVQSANEIDPYHYDLFLRLMENFEYISVFPSSKASQPLWDEMELVWSNLQTPVQACKLIERKINLNGTTYPAQKKAAFM